MQIKNNDVAINVWNNWKSNFSLIQKNNQLLKKNSLYILRICYCYNLPLQFVCKNIKVKAPLILKKYHETIRIGNYLKKLLNDKKIKFFNCFIIQWKPLNVITLQRNITDNLNQMITISICFCLVIFLNWTYQIWSKLNFFKLFIISLMLCQSDHIKRLLLYHSF